MLQKSLFSLLMSHEFKFRGLDRFPGTRIPRVLLDFWDEEQNSESCLETLSIIIFFLCFLLFGSFSTTCSQAANVYKTCRRIQSGKRVDVFSAPRAEKTSDVLRIGRLMRKCQKKELSFFIVISLARADSRSVVLLKKTA